MSRVVLVTGGAGFIGSHTCKRLDEAGFLPVVYDNLSTGHRTNVRWGPLVEGGLEDTDRIVEAIRTFKPECLIHFAASAYVGESVEDPGKYYRNNVAGSVSLLEACRQAGLARVVFSSTCATYGVPPRLPITEDTIQLPVNPYGRTKLMIELMLGDYARAYGFRSVALRYFNAAGADPDGQLTERHDPETHLIPRALMAAAGRLDRLDVFGDDYDTPDGTCIRDYIHVMDLAEAHVAAVDYLRNGGEPLKANLGSGHGTSVRQVIDAIHQVTRRRVPVQLLARRAGDPPVLYADTTWARRTLGFRPSLSNIETIIRTAAPGFGLEVRS
ncbi:MULTISPECIES: UDP-glucose 4-epimerase GalE [Ensifer]|jgi:UDP-arabinose 4-epimerase|uniref:UDP-glucose 4-epimerase n=1 Tax=Ensifer canadensis TaxID=555315 RepID=A0AAW4FTX3_9HYPH|nr:MULTISPECIES: UDP-glucose 4-epimerase GalE [Ensifer]AHK42536.1 UDP-glucose 4-epimerase [Ensifer adhaerens OV14]MDP9631449.1 UDP-arabinose 4-epimerase [Ensifer adhaerens]KQU82188.1 UDP-glucose 4-epimerase [Ensifer sp. Root31]KQW55502.1 UDP-glucose 4-epimerase [Ensifer sp. Root1252]KQW73629.1 UDP-glucose 4-epimerase [Ensifer sp. Root127]